MSWTQPRTWVTAEVPSAATMNTHIRDDTSFLTYPLAVLDETLDLVGEITAAQDLLSGSVTVSAGRMGTRGMLRGTIIGDYRNETTVGCRFQLALKLGGTTIWGSTTTNGQLAAHPNRHIWKLVFWIANLDAANSQFAAGYFAFSTQGSADVGIGDLATVTLAQDGPFLIPFASNGTLSIDTSADRLLELSLLQDMISPGGTAANLSFRRRWASIEVVGQAA